MIEKIAAIIITYNTGEEIYENLEALTDKADRIFIVDNGSHNKTLEMLSNIKNKYNNIKIILNKKNLGIARALNIGFEEAILAGYEWILTLDDDSKVMDDTIYRMTSYFNHLSQEKKDKIAIISPKYVEKKYYDKNIENDKSTEKKLFQITSGNLVKAEAYKQVQGFDDYLFIDYVDYDFCFKLRGLGYEIVQLNYSILLHRLGASIKKSFLGYKFIVTNHSAFRRYYITRNRVVLWKRYNHLNQWVKNDKRKFLNEFIKIVIFEDDKLNKIRMIVRGIKDSQMTINGIGL